MKRYASLFATCKEVTTVGILAHLFGPPPKHQPGVYRIANRKTGCIYIGATTQPISVRWAQHRAQLNGGRHHNKRLQADWMVHGPRAFKFSVLEVVYDTALVFERERDWQLHLYTPDGCYNPDPNALPPYMKTSAIPREAKLFLFKVARGTLPKTRQNIRKAFEGMGVQQSEEAWDWLWEQTEQERLAGRLVVHPSSIDENAPAQ